MEWAIGIVSGLISGAITGGVYYFMSGEDIAREAKDLHELSVLNLRALESAGVVEFNRDDSGRFRGIRHQVTVGDKLNISSRLVADATIVRNAGQDEQFEPGWCQHASVSASRLGRREGRFRALRDSVWPKSLNP